MRIKVIQRPAAPSIDGLDLGRFEPGSVYDVGTSLGCLMLCEGWAEPVGADTPAQVVPLPASDLPPNAPDAAIEPDAAAPATRRPANVVRQRVPPDVDVVPIAADFHRRRPRR